MKREAMEFNRPWHIETTGIMPVALTARDGKASDLFWVWCGANLGLMSMVYGAILLSLGLNFVQGLLVIILGTASFFLVGMFSIAGAQTGLPMMALSRRVFGKYGNVLPALVSWISLLGWETISVITGTLALMILYGFVEPHAPVAVAMEAMATMVVCTILASLMGQATLVVIQKWASYIFGVLTLGIIGLLVMHTSWAMVWNRPYGSWIHGFLPALSIVIAGTGLSWTNAAADYSRYVGRPVLRSKILWSVVLGAAIPLVILMSTGLLMATRSPHLATAANPIAVIGAALPRWASIAYLVTAAAGLVVEADLSLYSSGLNLMALFVPFERYKTVAIDAVVMMIGTAYVVLVAQNFLAAFESFVLLLGVGLAAWAGVFLAAQVFSHLLQVEDGAVPKVRLWPIIGWGIAVSVGLIFTDSPYVHGVFSRGVFANSSLSLLIAFIVGAGLFLVSKPSRIRVSRVASRRRRST